jgi:hypothetical protein
VSLVSACVRIASYFLVEWYQSGPAALSADAAVAHLTRAAATDTEVPPVVLVTALLVPKDETFFGVFSAASADAVIQTCQGAGWPADRISIGVQPWPRPDLL